MKRFLMPVALAGLVFCLSAMVPADDLTITISASPKVLILNSQGGSFSIHSDIRYGDVDVSTVKVLVETGALNTCGFGADSRGQLVAKCDIEEVKAAVEPGFAFVELIGETKTTQHFRGSDTIVVR
jgi:hypothetical protein